MIRHIKRSVKYLIIFFGVIILLPTVLYLLLQTAEVQTFLVKRITGHLSAQIKSTISVGSIEYKFFNKLLLNNVLIKDQNNDTLLYTKQINVGIRQMDFKNKSFRLGKVSLIKPVIALITDTTGMMNLAWYLKLIQSPPDTVKSPGARITVQQVDINDARFSLIDRSVPKSDSKLDFSNINLSGLNGTIEDFQTFNDTTSFNIYSLAFREAGGFTVKKMSSSVMFASQNIFLKSIFLNLDSSILNIPKVGLTADSASYFGDFVNKVKLDVQIDKSLVSSQDLKYFLPFADSLNESIWLSGKIMGTISELRGRDIRMSYRNSTALDCDFDLSGLPKIENTFLYIGVNSLKTNISDIGKIRLAGDKPLVIPEELKNLGTISFNGSFTGFTTDFVTYGELRTKEGNIRTDISLRPEKDGRYKIKGLLAGSDINLGQLAGDEQFLGHLSIHANVDGYASSLEKFAANLTGQIDSLELNNYTYRNISLNGSFTEKTWDGSIKLDDKNIKLDLLGLLNFNNKLPEFDFTLNVTDANLYKLNFDKPDTTSRMTILLTSNFKGSNLDNLDGQIKLINSKFRKFGKDLELYDFSIKTNKENNHPGLSLRTDFLDADIKGYYNFSTFGSMVKHTLNTLMPTQFHYTDIKNDFKKNSFTFAFNFKNTDKINTFFRTGVQVSENSYIKGSIYADSLITITGKSDRLNLMNNVFQDFALNAEIREPELSLDISSTSFTILGQSELKDLKLGMKTTPDNFIFKVDWDNKDKVLNKGSFTAHASVAKNTSGGRFNTLNVTIDSSNVYTDNNLWKVKSSAIQLDSTYVNINNFYVTSKGHSYRINGAISENPADTLHLEFRGIDIDPLNYLLDKKGTNPDDAVLNFKGEANGNILVSNVYKNLILAGNIAVNNFSVLGTEFGRVNIRSELDNQNKTLIIKASNNLNSAKMFDVNGYYDPGSGKIDLTASANKLPVSFLNPLLKTFASDITGTASGKVHLLAENDRIYLKGAVLPENTSMKISYLQTKYNLRDSVRFDKEGIKFNKIRVTDQEGNQATLNGAVLHRNFDNYIANLRMNVNSRGFLVLNTSYKDNPIFYGTAYVDSGSVARVTSDANLLSFDISAKTSKSLKTGRPSKLFIPISKGLSVSEYSYITFKDSTKTGKRARPDSTISASLPSNDTGMDLNMNLEITPDAEIQIIFDAKVGDVMKGHGSSENLNVNLNRKGDLKIYGEYRIEDGEYTFTMGPIINKPFSVESGGTINFAGDLSNAEIELKASYLNMRVALASILEDEKYSERIRVEPQLNLSGKLFNPVIGFDIYLPDADEETRTRLKNAISTQEELTRQVTSLLLINNFISTGPASLSTATTATSAVAATSFEMISNQVSNMLSQAARNVDIGLNIRPGSNTITPQEAQLALSTQLLHNRVTLNGNFDVRGNGYSGYGTVPANAGTNQMTGDFDASIRLTEKLQFKVFNRYNDIATGLSPYTQGVGIFYKQDFNRFADLFRKKNKAEMKKEEETKMKAKDK